MRGQVSFVLRAPRVSRLRTRRPPTAEDPKPLPGRRGLPEHGPLGRGLRRRRGRSSGCGWTTCSTRLRRSCSSAWPSGLVAAAFSVIKLIRTYL